MSFLIFLLLVVVYFGWIPALVIVGVASLVVGLATD